MNYDIPAISVIIPMYNTEKYVKQCLESVLSQTFQDFEVIVVDDCSKDKSFSIVENLIPSFNGRLHLIKHKKNSGGCAVPRNTGLKLSRGKYVFFLDSDDLIINTAFQRLYDIAEKNHADVVHGEKYYVPLEASEKIDSGTKFKLDTFKTGNFVDKIVIETDDIADRIKRFSRREIIWVAWNQLVRRDFLVENDIEFINMISEDFLFTFFCLCCAKTFIHIPDVFYIYRQSSDSIMRKEKKLETLVHEWVSNLNIGMNMLDNFMNGMDFFVKNPSYRYLAFNSLYTALMRYMSPIYNQVQPYILDDLLRKELYNSAKECIPLTAYLFNLSSIYRINFFQEQQKNIELQKRLQEKNNNNNIS